MWYNFYIYRMNNLRILFTGTVGECIPPPYGGIPKRALMLGAEWKKNGVVVGYVFNYHHENEDDLGAKGEYFFEFDSKPNKLTKVLYIIRHLILNPSLYFKLLSIYKKTYRHYDRQSLLYPAYGVFLNNIYSKFRPNIIVSEAALIQSFMAGHVAKINKIPFVIETYAEIHDKDMTKSLRFSDSERSDYWKNFLSLADHIITPSNYCAIGPRQYIDEKKETMIYATTLDVDRFDKEISIEEKNRLRDKFKIPREAFVIMAVGAFTYRKGHDHIIEALGTISVQNKKIIIALCGAGNPDWLKKLATDIGVEKRVYFYQSLSEEDLTDLYHTADTYCDASNTPRACLGIALTDALASHLPTIAYDIAGLPESVHDGENGYLVPVNNIKVLGKKFDDMSNKSVEERKTLGDKGVVLARKIFNIPIIAKQLLDIFLNLNNKI